MLVERPDEKKAVYEMMEVFANLRGSTASELIATWIHELLWQRLEVNEVGEIMQCKIGDPEGKKNEEQVKQ